MNKFSTVNCDVLCIGGSGAAVSAAYTASSNNKKVIMVSKGKTGRSGNAVMVGGAFGIDGYNTKHVLKIQEANEKDTEEVTFEKIVKSSFYLSEQPLVEQFIKDAPIMVKTFLEWSKKAKQKFLFVKNGLFTVSGRGIGQTIYQGIKECPDITVYNDVIVLELLVRDQQVAGALGFDIYKGEYIVINAKAVVMGTGGYQPHSLKNTITDMTGDGMAMALRAGARIADMEFLLYIPTAISPNHLKGSILPYLFTIPIFMPLEFDTVDEKGNEIIIPEPFKSIPGSNKFKKLIYSYYWGKSIHENNDNGTIFYDFSKFSIDSINNAFEHFIKHYSQWHKLGYYNGINLIELRDNIIKERKLAVSLGSEYSNGGIVINENMETDIKGLYAAGEVTSGLFGAFRAADGLTEMLAHGYRAGKQVLEYMENNNACDVSIDDVKRIINENERVFGKKGIRANDAYEKLENAADKGFSYIRNEENLTWALNEIQNIRKNMLDEIAVDRQSMRYNVDYIRYLQLKNLCLCAESGVQAALLRKESRGTHVRNDFPHVDNQHWLNRITSNLENDELIYNTLRPTVTKIPLPKENFKSIPDYIQSTMQ